MADVLHPHVYVMDTVSLLRLAKAHNTLVSPDIKATATKGDPLKVIDLLSEGKHTLLIPHACIKEALRGKEDIKYGIQHDANGKWRLHLQKASFKRPESKVFADYLEQKQQSGKLRYMTLKAIKEEHILEQSDSSHGIIIVETESIAGIETDGKYPLGKGHNSEDAIKTMYSKIYNHFQSSGIRLPLVSPHIPLNKIVNEVSERYGRDSKHSSVFSLNAAVAGLMVAGALDAEEANTILKGLEPTKSTENLLESIKSTGMTRFAAAFSGQPPSAITR